MTPEVTNQRLATVPITLKDGTYILAGTRIACANADILNDPEITTNPETFNPMRSHRKRYETGDLSKNQAGQTTKTNLHFSYRRQACLGRHFAVGEIKIILSRLILEYKFKYLEGKGRPRNFYASKNAFLDPRAKLIIRKRRTAA